MLISNSAKSALSRRAILASAGIAILSSVLAPQSASASSQDYRFELVGAPVNSGKITLVKVRLVHVPDGKPVSGAIIVQAKFDMGPDGMASMTAPAKGAASSEPGIYQVETQPAMEGNWALTLAAKVQGEPDTVRGTVTVVVPK